MNTREPPNTILRKNKDQEKRAEPIWLETFPNPVINGIIGEKNYT